MDKIIEWDISSFENKNNSLYYKLFFIGIILYELGNIFISVFPNESIRLIQFFGLTFLCLSIFKTYKNEVQNGYFRKVFYLFLLWNFVIVSRFQYFSFNELRLALFQPIHFFAYLVPLVVLFPVNKDLLNKLFCFSYISCFLFVIVYFLIAQILVPQNNLTDLIVDSFIPGAIILFFSWKYHGRSTRNLSFLVIIVALIAGAIAGRRNIVITCASCLFIGWGIIVFFYNKRANFKKILLIFVTTYFLLLAYVVYNLNNINSFSLLFERLDIDSRGEVIDYFLDDFEGLDWIIGRGIDGKYYHPIRYWNFSNEDSREVEFRENVENGFLFIILKGGIISLILFFAITVPAIFLGIFKSNNAISKAFGAYILIFVIDMVSFGQNSLSINYIFLWISIGVCYSSKIRVLPEKYFRTSLRNNT